MFELASLKTSPAGRLKALGERRAYGHFAKPSLCASATREGPASVSYKGGVPLCVQMEADQANCFVCKAIAERLAEESKVGFADENTVELPYGNMQYITTAASI